MAKTKNNVSDWIGPQPDDPKPIIYLSGVARSIGAPPEVLYKETGYRFYCLSYAYCAPDGPRHLTAHEEALHYYLKSGLRLFLDSGAHTFHELAYAKLGTRGKPQTSSAERLARSEKIKTMIEEYANRYATWLRSFPPKTFDFYVNLDYKIHAPTIYAMLHHLQDVHKIRPIPVYHGDSSIDWLMRYVDEGHRMIGIGWNPAAHGRPQRRRYYDKVFEFAAKHNLYLHGFACTGTDAFAYPWYSVDSTTWLKTASYGGICEFRADSQGRARFKIRHVSERKLPEELKENQDLAKFVISRGFALQDLRTSLKARALYNVMAFVKATHDFTPRSSRIAWKGTLC